MDADFGISKALPSLPQEEQDKVVQFLKDQGVNEEEDLKIYTEEDFTKRGLLKPVKAKRLIQFWKKGGSSETHEQPAAPSPSQSGKFIQNTHGNAERVIATSGNYNETHNNADTINKFDNARDVQTGGTSYKTNFEKEVNSDVLVTGQGNVYKK